MHKYFFFSSLKVIIIVQFYSWLQISSIVPAGIVTYSKVVVSLGINCSSSVYYKNINSATLIQNNMYCYQEKGNPEVNSLLKVFQIISIKTIIHLYKLYCYL